MKRAYKHLFFDLDHTLWDHGSNADATLADLCHQYQLADYPNFSVQAFQKTFHEINHDLWHQYHLGQVDQHHIRHQRFRMVMEALDIVDFEHCSDLGEQYLQQCPRRGHLMPYALEVLEYLSQKYPMTIITNGFDEIQELKLNSSGIAGYFNSVITSEKAGCLKPHPGIFDFAMREAAVVRGECLMIGDNPVTDMGGAINSGIDQVYYNSRGCADLVSPTYTIDSLIDLKSIL